MPTYYLNRNAGTKGEHEVHKNGCVKGPIVFANKLHLGEFDSCSGAVSAAKSKGFLTADGCKHCSVECHKL